MTFDKEGDFHETRLRAAIAQHEGSLIRYATRMMGDAERARDVVQDVFLKMCLQPPDQLPERLAPWLFAVCRNRAIDIAKKESRMSTLDDRTTNQLQGNEPAQPQRVQQKEDAGRARRLLESLSANQQEVIRLKIQEDLSYREISKVTGLSVTNVGYLLHTGLKTLREYLQ